MLNLNPWMEFVYENFISVNNKLLQKDPDQMRFIGINVMSYMIAHMVNDVLKKYTKDANIPKDFRANINMKNEFLFTRLILTDKKKRYISSVRLREGVEILPEEIDIKGHDFAKSTISLTTTDFFKEIIHDNLLYTDDINISTILKKLETFENKIKDSIMSGDKTFLSPVSVKELEAYADPLSQQGVRGVIAWNYLYPDMTIQLPEKVDFIKVKLTTLEQLEELKDIDEDKYLKLKKHIFNNPNPKIVKKGVSVISIPRNIDKIPEWILPFIDYDTIVNDNVSKFNSVLQSLGIKTVKASTKKHYTNILTV